MSMRMYVGVRLFVRACDGGLEKGAVWKNWSCSEPLQSEPVLLPKKTVVGRVC